jgi:CxxC motif-containing protein (DUF1111 family)
MLLLPLVLAGAAIAQPPPPPPPQNPTQPPGTVVDPGPHPGGPNSGQPLPGLDSADLAAFNSGKNLFLETITVPKGLGPRFNSDSCVSCHAQPAPGGTSPNVNNQIPAATRDGAHNQIPAFITPNGPTRAARLRRNPDGTASGGVLDLFVITGRADAPGCEAAQPNFAALIEANNLTYRIPTPLFGLGLIESIPDATLVSNLAANSTAKAAAGIIGRFNTNPNDGTITRFGWKAQNKSLLIFSGEAFNVEEGVTNELFPNERDSTSGCQFNGTPEDFTNTAAATAVGSWSGATQFANFMRYLAQPVPGPATSSTSNGQQLFTQIGCAMCHTPSVQTGASSHAQLSNQAVHLFSDLALHHMGTGLDDAISQGVAGTDEFRTAPLWGLGERIFFLHDGRAQNLLDAIADHSSEGSEAVEVVNQYNALSASQKQDLINFLRSL